MATINLHGHNYTVVPAHTKKAQMFWDRFCESSDTELRDVYGRYSRAKENAYDYCRARENEFSSYNGVIASHNSMMFTYAFTGWCECKRYLIYITRDRDYAIELQ